MKIKMKKYPLFVCMIISCVIIVASLFILGFFGLNLGTSLGGGSQLEITMADGVSSSEYSKITKNAIKENGYTVDSIIVQDKYEAGSNNTEFTKSKLVVKIAKLDISDEDEMKIRYALADCLNIDVSEISTIENITSVVKAKNVLFIGLAVGIIAICLFVMGWIRYDIFAGLSFILTYLHNIILYLSILILTRVQLNLISLSVMLVLTLVMSALLIQIYEKHKEESKAASNEKLTVSECMLMSEKQILKPYLFVGVAVLIFACLLLFVPVMRVTFTALNIIISLVVTAYTGLLVGPGVYASLLEIKDYNQKARLSRNENVNKAIKKKIKKNISKSENTSK